MPDPIRNPESRRGLQEAKFTPDSPDYPCAPEWLPEAARFEFNQLVKMLADAKVPLKNVDQYSITMAIMCISGAVSWFAREQAATNTEEALDCSKMVAKYQKDSFLWLGVLGASPLARSRMGLRGVKRESGPIAEILKRKQANG